MSFEGPAVAIRGVSKSYSIRHQAETGFRGRVGLREKLRAGLARGTRETFWALRDVSYDIAQGEILGIVGRNGAGKSTLLKILSRITEPTHGEIEINGRLSSLLEVGTGFHPELTGRENVYLNSSILGMRRAEIDSRFDEIVDFAGVERFLDTPVKRYSSGMYVRLAFAVAAHLDPDILIVDEVLSVGDQAFQKKCLGKMQDVAGAGRTVILVSHNMHTVTRLCTSAIMMAEGQIVAVGRPEAVAAQYMSGQTGSHAASEWPDMATAPGNEVVRLLAVRACDERGKPSDSFDVTAPIRLEVEYQVLEAGHVLVPNFHVFNDEGVHLFNTGDNDSHWRYNPKPRGRFVSAVTIPGNFMAEGGAVVGTGMSTVVPARQHWDYSDALSFQVVDSIDSRGVRLDYAGHYPGVVRPWFDWSSQVLDEDHSTAGLTAVTAGDR